MGFEAVAQELQIGRNTDMAKHLLTPHNQSEHVLSLGSVWNFILPVIPDTLSELDGGIYEARWWKPVPTMDIEILKRTDGVILEGVPFEPENLSGGIAVQFRLS